MQSFPKSARLRKRSDFVRVQGHEGSETAGGQRGAGRKVHGERFLLLIAPPVDDRPPRIGVTVSSKVGHAVVRNRIKRWVREFVRRHKQLWPPGDTVIIARPSSADAEHEAVDRELAQLLGRASRGGR